MCRSLPQPDRGKVRGRTANCDNNHRHRRAMPHLYGLALRRSGPARRTPPPVSFCRVPTAGTPGERHRRHLTLPARNPGVRHLSLPTSTKLCIRWCSVQPTGNSELSSATSIISFVKHFKRDNVYLADLWTAADLLRDLPRWFDDYNRVRPHKGLRMLSPVEFRNQQLAS